jgi:glucoamylase
VREPAFGLTVGLRSDGTPVLVGAAEATALNPTTRVLSDPAEPARVEFARGREAQWLRSGSVPGSGGRWEAMARCALLDLRVLARDGGALVAGWPQPWRYVWPRDASFAAVAFAACGHPDQTAAILRFLLRVAPAQGQFEARYRPDGSGPPDDRRRQSDGAGWVGWAVHQSLPRLPADRQDHFLAEFRPLVDRAVASMLASVDRATGLPGPSADYWEVAEDTVTLGVAAPVLAGLQSAADLYRTAGDPAASAPVDDAAGRLQAAIEGAFGPDYPRHPGQDDPDAALTFLTAPIGRFGADAARAQRRQQSRLERSAGGLAPGAGWKNDGVSWTPETALFALAAAGRGDVAGAADRLDWLDRHRTSPGSIPEKVRYDGSAAGPAPLAWTAAAVLLTLDLLGPGAG